jgi:cellulose synthase/poly-beta-1,6-N-acetylglucosamine synthase-like glycosyltransferase
MTSQPFVSFIIPALNEEDIIGRCLDAVAGLNYDRELYECIVIDNGSRDDTLKIAAARGGKTFTMSGGTISRLRNFGAQKARGDFLAFVDADCVIDRDWLENALRHFRDSTVACVGSHPGIPEPSTWVQKSWNVQSRSQASVEQVDWLPSMNILVRKNAFIEVRGFNESLMTCEDVDFCYRLKEKRYTIVSDRSIKSVHHGEAKTALEFFRKERWRGRGNLQGLLSHGIYWREVPSLALPISYLILIALLPAAVVYSYFVGLHLLLLITLGGLSLVPLVLSLRASIRARDFSRLATLMFLYQLYSVARAIAVIPTRRGSRHKDLVT